LIDDFKGTSPTPEQQALLDQMATSLDTATGANADLTSTATAIGTSVDAINSDAAAVTAALPPDTGTGTGPVLVTTTTTLTLSETVPAAGDDVKLLAVVEEEGTDAVPTGEVTFSDNGTVLGTGTLDGTGQATFDVGAIVAGPHAFSASYAGDAANAASESTEVDVTV
jgi:hypothetical protein